MIDYVHCDAGCDGNVQTFLSALHRNRQGNVGKLSCEIGQAVRFVSEDNRVSKAGNTYLRYYFGEAANSVRGYVPEYAEFYSRKYAEVTKHQHKRALALTSRKFVRLVFGLLVKNQLYTGEKLDAELNTESE